MTGEESSVERVKRKLYTRSGSSTLHPRRTLHSEEHDVVQRWDDPQAPPPTQSPEEEAEHLLEELRAGHLPGSGEPVPVPTILADDRLEAGAVRVREERRTTTRIITAIFVASLCFFVIAAGIAGYYLAVGKNQVSCDNLVLDVSGPLSIASGKELVLNIGILNKNSIPLQSADLVLDYPEGARSATNTSLPFAAAREKIGTLEPNERVRTDAHVVLFGKEQTDQTITVSVEYHIQDSSAMLHCEQPYRIAIASSPVLLSVDGLEEVSSGQELTLTVTVHANAEEVVSDMRLIADYPFGFTLVRADPPPKNGKDVWEIGDVAPGSSRTITIHGVVQAQSVEAREVKFRLGEKDRKDERGLATTLQAVEHALFIARPFLALDLKVNNGAGPDITAPLGGDLNAELHWTNKLADPLYDVSIEMVLPSALVDRASVRVKNGFYRSVDNTIVWTPQTDDSLREVVAGAEGDLGFSLTTVRPEGTSGTTNPSLDLAFTIRASRVSDTVPVPQTLVAQAKRTVKFLSVLTLQPSISYTTGPFTNTGTHPPQVDKETTYTITWELTNTTNDVDDVTVHAALPVNVSWRNVIAPEGEQLTYSPVTREVTWTAGRVPVGTGYRGSRKQVSFQVGLIPSITQLGDAAAVIEAPKVSGIDHFTGSVLEQTLRPLTTELTNDPYFPGERGDVRS